MTEPLLREIIAELRRQNLLEEKPMPTIDKMIEWVTWARSGPTELGTGRYLGNVGEDLVMREAVTAILETEKERQRQVAHQRTWTSKDGNGYSANHCESCYEEWWEEYSNVRAND